MQKLLLRLFLGAALLGGAAALAGSGAGAAVLKLGGLVVRADGGFRPQALPRRAYAPIHFQGHADIASDSGPPPALQSVRLDFDRDGRLTTAGLATCPPERIEETAPAEARRRCKAAIVGTGHVAAAVTLPGHSTVEVRSALTLFNGPPQGGNPTVIAHARTTYPSPETFVVVVPIERGGGRYGYSAELAVPAIGGGHGALTHIDVRIGRRYRAHGVERSYTSARCSDGILETHGRFTFADGTVIEGPVEKPCSIRR